MREEFKRLYSKLRFWGYTNIIDEARYPQVRKALSIVWSARFYELSRPRMADERLADDGLLIG